MAIASKVTVTGNVIRIDTRSGKRKSDGEAYTINTALIVGPANLAEVTIPDALELPVVGKAVSLLVEVNVFRDDDQLRALEYLA